MNPAPLSGVLSGTDQRVSIRIKAVPGASRTRVVDLLGDRLKITVTPAPEGGKANRAICKLLAQTLGVSPKQVKITAGASTAFKTIEVTGIDTHTAEQRLFNAINPASDPGA